MNALMPALIATLLAAPGPEKPKIPQGATPTIATVAEINKEAGTCTLQTNHVVAQTVNVPVTEIVNGVAVTKVVPETRLKTVVETRPVSIKDMPVTDAEGNKIAEDDVWKRLTQGTTVVVSADGNKVDPAFLAAFKKDTLVLQPARR
jgi:hypothetical protein